MLTVATWKWRGTREYTSNHVNALFRAVSDNLHIPHRFVCITDDPVGLDDNINVVELPEFEHIAVRPGFPSSYVRLLGFCPEFSRKIGERILTLDIDVVITGDLTPLVVRDEDFVAWSDPDLRGLQYHGGMYLMTAGCRPQVWETFDRDTSPETTKRAGLTGSDQAWISYCLFPNEAIWEKPNGIYRTRNIKGPCPEDARIVQFPGSMKPWSKMCEDQHPDLYALWWKYARAKNMGEMHMGKGTYVNNVNFYDGKQMRRQGEVNEAPSDAHIRAGLVREVKVEKPSETKRSVKRATKRSNRKSADTAEQDSKLD